MLQTWQNQFLHRNRLTGQHSTSLADVLCSVFPVLFNDLHWNLTADLRICFEEWIFVFVSKQTSLAQVISNKIRNSRCQKIRANKCTVFLSKSVMHFYFISMRVPFTFIRLKNSSAGLVITGDVKRHVTSLDVYGSVHRNINLIERTNKM